MDNEEKKGFNRFFFSTELDRGDVSETGGFEVEQEKPNKSENNNDSNRRRNNNRRNNRRRNSRSRVNRYANKRVENNVDVEPTTPEQIGVIPYNDAVSTIKSEVTGPIPYNDSISTIQPVEEKETIPTADFKVFGSEEEVLEEKEPVGPIPYNDSISTIKNEAIGPIPYNDSISTIKNEAIGPIPYNDAISTIKDEKEDYALEDEINSLKEKGIHVADSVRDIDLDHTLFRDQYFIQNPDAKDEVVEEVKEALEAEKSEHKPEFKISKIYLSFQTRVILLLVGVVLLFGTACFIIASTLQNNSVRKTNFVENTKITYDVCQSAVNPYNDLCLKEGNIYPSSDSSIIHVGYQYEAKFAKEIPYDMSYHVVVVNKIYDHNDPNKVSYEDEDLLIDKKEVPDNGNPATLDVNVDVDFQKYNRFVNEYKEQYSKNVDGVLNVILYLDDGEETRNVGEVNIPLGEKEFAITSKNVTDSKQVYLQATRDWTNTNTLYIVVGSVFVLLSLFLLFHLTKLAMSVTGKKSKYQELLLSILNEYDRQIVIARDGYESAEEKEIIKANSFQELLDKGNSLNKPIIYSRVNNVKSEFIVEDETVIYKFVLKEADLEG